MYSRISATVRRELRARPRVLLHFTWTSRVMLKHIGVKFELLTDIDMVMFVKRRIREDLSKCSAQANNKYMQSSNRKIHRNRCILCIFYVNLYDWTMCQPCHTPIFDDVENFNVMISR